jgi:formamidopyrimidine-DNA glycosylase
MTGALLLDPIVEPPHTRVTLRAGRTAIEWSIVDPRRFGTGTASSTAPPRGTPIWASGSASSRSTPAFTADHLRRLARGRRGAVKSFILDQRLIAGVGNIYADEALFRAGIHPLREAGSLRRGQITALRDAIEAALAAGIEAKGATIDDFRHLDGARGSFQDRFLVHRREGEPCPRCGTAIRKMVVGGRGTYVCEHCQPRPRPRPRGRPA